jgi:hypothetical protein
MADLLTSVERQNISGIIDDVFDTFKRPIVIYKQPIKTVVSTTSSSMYGYNESSREENFTYTEVSGTFYATIKYLKNENGDAALKDINATIDDNIVRIKVKDDAKNFINNSGENYKVTFDDKSFEFISNDTTKRFLDNTKYYYILKEIK